MTTTPAVNPGDHLTLMLRRSAELHDALLGLVERDLFDSSSRSKAVASFCSVSLEHAAGLRTLVAHGYHTSAISLMRLQFEFLTRAIWLLYIASDTAITRLAAPLSRASEQAAKNLPSVNEMLNAIGKGAAAGKCPPAADEMLRGFRENAWTALNSFVHAGIHPLRRHAEGYPVQLVLDVLRNSNGLSTMAGMALAILTRNEYITRSMARVQPQFADCLPDLYYSEGPR